MFYPYDDGIRVTEPDDGCDLHEDEGFGMFSGVSPEEKDQFGLHTSKPQELDGFGLIW